MRLHEIAMVDAPHYKGQSKTPEVYDDDAFDIRTNELRSHLAAWGKIPNPSEYDKYMIQNMERELAEFEEIGELPFTFYAAQDRDDAEFFSDQFSDGEVREVRVTAKNLATSKDLHDLGFLKTSVSHLQPMMIHKLKKAGFDGATGTIDRLNGTEVVVFSPEQVKVI